MPERIPGSRLESYEKIYILIIEDQLDVAKRLSGLLESGLDSENASCGVDIRIERTMKQGLAAISQVQPDLVFVDIGLPDSCGIHNLDRVRGQCTDSAIVVLADRLTPILRKELSQRAIEGVIETSGKKGSFDFSTRIGRLIGMG
ncbi:MAG: hypothetical protein COB96_00155 [Planctomycetota bacterium]|nr:MAG: hypothetical protein COB96_00155 [Planctomycetota bacterium]